MPTKAITQKQILSELKQLEPARWPEVLDFIAFMRQRAAFTPKQAVPISQHYER